MTIRVPATFAESMRQKRLLCLAILAIFSFVAAMFRDPQFAYAGYPLIAYIIIILATYKMPLLYRIAQRGIYLTTPTPALAMPLSLAMNFWVAWPFDRVVDIQHTHHDNHPALLIRTRFNKRGSIVPVLRADAESVATYLRSTPAAGGANAFS